MEVKNEKLYDKSNDKVRLKREANFKAWGLSAAGGLAIGIGVTPTPAKADGVTDITTMVTSLGTIATGVTTVVLGAMVVRLGIKFVNRMTVKG